MTLKKVTDLPLQGGKHICGEYILMYTHLKDYYTLKNAGLF